MARREHYQGIIEAFESGDSATAVSDFVNLLETPVQNQIISSIRSPPIGITSVTLLRALWCNVSLRPKILTSFAASAPREPTGHEAQLLDELELLLAGDARDVTVSAKWRLRSITLCATAISKAAARNSFSHHGPLLLFCARAAGQIGTQRGKAVRARIINCVLRFLQIPGKLRLPSIAAILEDDLQFHSSDEMLLISAVDTFVVLKSKECEQPALFRILLIALGRAKTQRMITVLGRLALYVLHASKVEGLSELLMILGVVFLESTHVCRRLLKAFSDLINGHGSFERLNCAHIRLGVPHVSALYYILGYSSSLSLRTSIGRLLEQIAEDGNIPLATTQVASSSSDARDPEFWRKAVLSKSMNATAVRAHGEAIAGFYEAQIWSQRAAAQIWGVRLLFEVFTSIPNAREKVLAAISSAVIGEKTPESVVDAFSDLLEQLCSSNRSAFFLRDCSERLRDMLKYIEHVPLGYDNRIVSAIVKLGVPIPNLRDQIFIFLQKVTGSRLWKLQRVAGAGLIAIIDHPAATSEAKAEACSTLVTLLDVADLPVRIHLIFLLIQFLGRNPCRANEIKSVVDLVVNRTLSIDSYPDMESTTSKRAKRNGEDSCNFNFARNFESFDGEWYPKDDLPILLRFCSKARSYNPRVEKLMQNFVEYMGDTSRVVVDACKKQESHVPAQVQIKQLCCLYETLVCIRWKGLSFAHVQGYALCILIRDFLDGKERGPGGTKTRPRSSIVEICESTTFAATAARDSTLSEAVKLQAQHDCRPSLNTYIEALKDSIKFDIRNSLTQVVVTEIMNSISSILSDVLAKNSERVAPQEVDMLLRLSRTCFATACPWSQPEGRSGSTEELESVVESDQTTKLSGEESHNDSIRLSKAVARGSVVTAESQPVTLPEIGLEHEDARKAIEASRMMKQALTIPFALRQLSLCIFFKLLKANLVKDQWLSVLSFLGESPKKLQNVGHMQQNQRVTRQSKLKRLAVSREGGKECETIHVKTVKALCEVFCNEFEHSLSIGLTNSYLELFDHLLSITSGTVTSEKSVKKVVESTLTKLLQEYSITNQKVLRSMLNLLMKAFDQSSGPQFASAVFHWLGNDACLLNSWHSTREEERNSLIAVDSFDLDILQEAMAIDMENVDGSEEVLDPHCESDKHVDEDSCSTESANMSPREDDQKSLDPTSRSRSEKADPVRSLCLNESEETGILSFNCLLSYLGSLLKRALEVCRRRTRDRIVEDGDLLVLPGVVSALEELFRTSFAEMKSPRSSRMTVALRRRIGTLLLILTEIAMLHVQALGKAAASGTRAFSTDTHSIKVAKQSLWLLDDENVENLLESLQGWDQSSRSAFLQEKLDATAAAFLAHADVESKDLDDIRSVLRVRVEKSTRRRERSRLLKGDEEALPGTTLGARPAKKQRIRSRNKQVDEWLRQERGDDNFADLEDFVVPMDASDL